MALAFRRLSKINQLNAGRAILQHEVATPVRFFATETDSKQSNRPILKGDQMLKDIFMDVKNTFESAVSVFRKEKITIDPNDPAAVSRYAQVMKMAREKAGIPSISEYTKKMVEDATKDLKDMRSVLLAKKDLRIKLGLDDYQGAEAMMFEALDKVEKQLKRPLMMDDKKGMDLMKAEQDVIYKKMGISPKDIPKIEADDELAMAKEQLEGLKKDCLDAMEAQAKREEFKHEEIPDPKTLDIRNFL